MKYLNLISGPRNISTALMYSFAQRPDTLVLDEPFYGVYLARSKADHPGADQVFAHMSADEYEVLRNIYATQATEVLFIKNMAHHIEVMDHAFLSKMTNVFLIRDPKQIIASYAEVISNPTMRDIGIEYEFELFQQLKEQGQQPVVIDSGLLLLNPGKVLKELCVAVGIAYNDAMLRWPAGPKPYDGIWAPYWYANVHRSTGFERQQTSSRPLPDRLRALSDVASHYYENLLSFALRP